MGVVQFFKHFHNLLITIILFSAILIPLIIFLMDHSTTFDNQTHLPTQNENCSTQSCMQDRPAGNCSTTSCRNNLCQNYCSTMQPVTCSTKHNCSYSETCLEMERLEHCKQVCFNKMDILGTENGVKIDPDEDCFQKTRLVHSYRVHLIPFHMFFCSSSQSWRWSRMLKYKQKASNTILPIISVIYITTD